MNREYVSEQDFKERMMYLIKEIKFITDSYCYGQCKYLNIVIFPDTVTYNNEYWCKDEPFINEYIKLDNKEEEEYE